MAHGFYRDDEVMLPHKPIPLAVHLIVEQALRLSWERLKGRVPSGFDIRTADEDEVTHGLYEEVLDRVFATGLVDGFDEEHFSIVTRESKLRNFNGEHLDKMPDLLVRVAGRTLSDFHHRSQDWLFIECKPVDASHTIGVHYGAKGIARFVRGDYAWAMTSALMVGYSNAGYDINPKLVETLARRSAEFRVLGEPAPCHLTARTHGGAGVFSSFHGRDFCYPENGNPAPPIRIRHLWLPRE